ncbi:lipase family protein [Nocardia sp. CDC159]|uniref:Lipase family protein n=1 Tax=Nocardia pulmonis TaxID=2951408 RepID=A0A9X2EB91_9NOCA|nr:MULTISPECIES: lipase family protein [Nocardia]MCM6777126.1 lipase family protein [Nocardia pulmonis]MCM6790011.1 lipase family protein [Nocardia sp. CDC159]
MFTMRKRRHRHGFALTAVAVAQVALAAIATASPECPCAPDGPGAAPAGFVSDNPDMYTGPVDPLLPFPIPPTAPEFDPFYHPPAERFVDLKPGQIIAARKVNLAGWGVFGPLDVDAWQLSFRSNNSRGVPIPAVTTVVRPKIGPNAPDRKLFSFQVPEDSLAEHCAPSYNFQLASVPANYMGQIEPFAEFIQPFQQALRQGWDINIPDFQGPYSAFAAGPLSGQITLDSIRAAENFYPLDLNGRHTPVTMQGHLGGAIPTQFAAELRQSYAPDLNIVGAAVGGPPTDLEGMINYHINDGASPTMFDGLIGLSREYPELDDYLNKNLDGFGQVMRAWHSTWCMGWSNTIVPIQNVQGSLPPNFFQEPLVRRILDENRMGNTMPDMPMYYYTPFLDWVVPVRMPNELVDNYCRENPDASIHYVRDHASESITLPYFAQPSVDRWLTERMDGIPAQRGCTTVDVATMATPNNASAEHGGN